MITKGTGTLRRKNARNYIQDEADKRLREVVAPYQRQGLNALGVDSFEVKFYHTCRSTQLCSCQQTEVLPQYGSKEGMASVLTMKPGAAADKEIVIDYARPLFGTVGDSAYAEDETEDDVFALDDADPEGHPTVDNLFSSSSDCALCFKTGYIPGYELYGYDRRVLTPFDIEDVAGYHKDVTTSPHTLTKLDRHEGYVEFILEVPKYLAGMSYVIRKNLAILVDDTLQEATSGVDLTLPIVKSYAGSSLKLRCTSEAFTHIVIEFDLGTERVKANLSQASRATDWTMFDTLSNVQIILPMTIQDVSPSDVVHVPSRNTTFKISDEQYLRTSQDRNLDWSVNARILQPTETLRSIHKTIALR